MHRLKSNFFANNIQSLTILSFAYALVHCLQSGSEEVHRILLDNEFDDSLFKRTSTQHFNWPMILIQLSLNLGCSIGHKNSN